MRTNLTPRRRGLIFTVWALSAAFTLAACGGGDSVDPDGGMVLRDNGVQMRDGGQMLMDSGQQMNDSGQFMLAGMRVREFLFGREVELRSPLSPDELRSRINGAAGWMFWPFQSDRIVGGITFGWMRLRYMSGPFEYNAKPVLSGRVQADLSGSHIRARFGASVSTRFFFVLWYDRNHEIVPA